MTNQEREDYIRDCGRKMEAALAAGNRQEAEGWLQAQNLAALAHSDGELDLPSILLPQAA